MTRSAWRLALGLLVLAGTAGCGDEAVHRFRAAIAARWEAFRSSVDAETKARARRHERRPASAAPTPAAAAAEAPIDEPAWPPGKVFRLDPAATAEIVAFAAQQRAQSLTVKLHGKTVVAKRWGRQDDLHAMMQMTYPIVALAIGPLLAEGGVPSLDTPIGRWLPAFAAGDKARVTLRDVMTGRDGLKGPEPWPGGLYKQRDYIGFYAGTALDGTPSEGQVMPRESAVLLGAVVRAATGMPLDRWVATRLLEPLGIRKSRWRRDAAGNIDAWAGLWLPPEGALRVGELVLAEGRWNGRQVLPRDWVLEATSPAGTADVPGLPEAGGYGWRVGIRERQFENVPTRRRLADRRYGIEAGDFIGNHLIVNPTKRLVALYTVPWDGAPITRSIDDFEFDTVAEMLDDAAR